jgi:hypothetical protein
VSAVVIDFQLDGLPNSSSMANQRIADFREPPGSGLPQIVMPVRTPIVSVVQQKSSFDRLQKAHSRTEATNFLKNAGLTGLRCAYNKGKDTLHFPPHK